MTRGIAAAQLRVALAVIAMIDLVSFYFFIGEARERALLAGAALGWFVDALSRAPVRAAVIAIGIGGAIAFARAAGRLAIGFVPLVALMLLSNVHGRLFGSPWRHLYYSGLCLFGWLMGLAVARVRGTPSDESYARTGALALLGAAYLNAGLSKLAFGGLDWTSGAPIQAVIVAQDGLVRDGVLSTYRSWVVMTPAVAASFSFATVLFEVAGPLMLLGGVTRAIVALGLLGMHSNIYVLTGILYWESMVFLVLLGVLPYREAADARGTPLPVLSSPPAFRVTAAVLAVAALFAIVHQQGRYTAWANRRTDADVPPRVAEPEKPAPRRIGPFAVGDEVAQGWAIERLTPTPEGFRVTVNGPAGQARFDVNCVDVEHRSPFDVGRAHIFYPRDVPLSLVEPVGNVLRDRLQSAAAARDPCQVVNDWTASVR